MPPSSYLGNPVFSDLHVQAGATAQTFRVHKVILCSGLAYFRQLLMGRNLAVCRFLYGQPCTLDLAEWRDGVSLTPHILVSAAAHGYGLGWLNSAAAVKIKRVMPEDGAGFEAEQINAVRLLGTMIADQQDEVKVFTKERLQSLIEGSARVALRLLLGMLGFRRSEIEIGFSWYDGTFKD